MSNDLLPTVPGRPAWVRTAALLLALAGLGVFGPAAAQRATVAQSYQQQMEACVRGNTAEAVARCRTEVDAAQANVQRCNALPENQRSGCLASNVQAPNTTTYGIEPSQKRVVP